MDDTRDYMTSKNELIGNVLDSEKNLKSVRIGEFMS